MQAKLLHLPLYGLV